MQATCHPCSFRTAIDCTKIHAIKIVIVAGRMFSESGEDGRRRFFCALRRIHSINPFNRNLKHAIRAPNAAST
jgi:hypothetical protein